MSDTINNKDPAPKPVALTSVISTVEQLVNCGFDPVSLEVTLRCREGTQIQVSLLSAEEKIGGAD